MDKYQTLHEKNTPTNNVYPNIQTQNVPDGAITMAKIADGAINTAKIADDAITTAKITDNTITTTKIVDNAITTAKIADATITNAKLGDGSVTTLKIANLSIETAKLKDECVNIDKLKIDIEDWTTPAIQGLQDLYNEVINLLTDIKILRIYYSNGGSVTDFVVKANDNLGNITFIFNNSEMTLSTDQDAEDFYTNYISYGYIKVIRIGE